MMGLVDLVDQLDLQGITTPVLVLYSEHDTVIDTARVLDTFEAIGSASKRIVGVETDDRSGHILAGVILSPSTTAVVGRIIESYLAEILADPNWLFAEARDRHYAHARPALAKHWRLP
jgi:poly(3-hydroxyalkanoate) synthetase